MVNHPNNHFIGACHRVDKALEQLTAIRANHFGTKGDQQRTWAEAQEATKLATKLEELIQQANRIAVVHKAGT